MNKIGVIGLGYVGLPLALLFASKGFQVVGIDLDRRKIDSISQGKSYIRDVHDFDLKEAVDSIRFTATGDYDAVCNLDSIIICVPTPLDHKGSPDLSFLQNVGAALSPRIKKGQLVVLESSTYPGTTKEFLQPILESRGLRTGVDFFLGYSPERIDPGNKSYRLEQVPKVISGVTDNCKKAVMDLYSRVFDHVVSVSSPEVAEFTKLLENSYRLINISFINEMAMMCDKMNIDVWEAIHAAKTKPFGFAPFYPGPGIGGHCIPVDPLYLLWKAKQHGTDSPFIRLGKEINRNISMYIVEEINKLLYPLTESGQQILIYGVSYKSDLEDDRETPALPIISSLMDQGFQIHYHDPLIPEFKVNGQKLVSVPLTDQLLNEVDCVIILTNHSNIPIQSILDHSKLVYDTRNVTYGWKGKAKVIRLGGGTDRTSSD